MDTNGENCMVWGPFFRSTLRGEDVLSAFLAAGDWVKKGSYHTVLSVSPVLRAIAPLMKPWCAEGDVLTAANLYLYRRRISRVRWHCDNEPLLREVWGCEAHCLVELWYPKRSSIGRASLVRTVKLARAGMVVVTS